MTADIIVLGAGPTGAGAAMLAARAGHDVALVERAGVAGGAAGSFELAGLHVDYGSHRLHAATDPEILAELRRLLGDDLQHRPRNGRIRLEGRWIRFPLRTTDLVRRLPPDFTLRATRDALLGFTRRASKETFESLMRAQLGPTLCDRFYFPYVRKLWGLEPDRIDPELARRRVSAGTIGRLLRRLAPGARPTGFWYPRRGYGQISESLAGAAAAAGAELRWSSAAIRVDLNDSGESLVELADGTRMRSRRVWSTIPVTALAELVDPPAPPAVLEAARSLRFRAMTFVYLILNCARYTPFDTHYLPEPFTPVTRISEPTNFRVGDEHMRQTVLCFEVPCERDDRIWRAEPAELRELAERALRDAALPQPNVADVEIRRLSAIYPVYDIGYDKRLATLTAWADSHPSLLTLGRQGLFAHDNAHHALAMAWAACECLNATGEFDDQRWRTALERFAEHVVED